MCDLYVGMVKLYRAYRPARILVGGRGTYGIYVFGCMRFARGVLGAGAHLAQRSAPGRGIGLAFRGLFRFLVLRRASASFAAVSSYSLVFGFARGVLIGLLSR